MTTTTYTEWHPHAGSIWARLTDLWTTYVQDTSLTWAAIYEANSGKRALKVTLTGTDTNIYRLLDASRLSSQNVPLGVMLNLPGMRVNPPVLAYTYGSRDVIADWSANLGDHKKSLLHFNWTGASTSTLRTDNFYIGGPNSTYTTMRHYMLQAGGESAIDYWSLANEDPSSTNYWYQNRVPELASTFVAPMTFQQPAAGGGSSVDLTALIACLNGLYAAGPQVTLESILAAINSIAHIDIRLTNRDGRSVLSVIGGSIVHEP